MADAARVKGTGSQRRPPPARSATREEDPAQVAAQLRSRGGAALTVGVLHHQDEAVATEFSRSAYNRERFIFLLRVLYIMLGAIIVLTIANVYLAVRPVQERYFAKDPLGGLRELVPLEKPIQSQNEMLA